MRTVTYTIYHGSGTPAHLYIKKMYRLSMWQSGEERKHLSVPIIQPNSNGKLTNHLLMKKENIPKGEIEENYKEGRKQY